MPQTSSATDSSEHFQSIFDKALKAYTKKTEKDLLSLPLFRELNTCDSAEETLNKLRDPNLGFNQAGNKDDSLSKWLIPTLKVLHTLSAIINQVVGSVRLRKLNTTHSGTVVCYYSVGIPTRESSLHWNWRPPLGGYSDSSSQGILTPKFLRRLRKLPLAKTNSLTYLDEWTASSDASRSTSMSR